MIYKFRNRHNDIHRLYEYLQIVDSNFPVSLSSRVDLYAHASTLLQFGHVYAEIECDDIIGAIAIDCNDMSNGGTLHFLSVRSGKREPMIARRLIDIAINTCRAFGMAILKCDTANVTSSELYKALGGKSSTTEAISKETKDILYLSISPLAHNEITSFLAKVNEDFCPHLTAKVDLHTYSKKILDNAILFTDIADNKICGLVVLYCNNQKDKYAYIPLVAVHPEYRNQGIAKRLMLDCIDYVRAMSFDVIGIHSNNEIAIKTYKSLGFEYVEGEERIYMKYQIKEK